MFQSSAAKLDQPSPNEEKAPEAAMAQRIDKIFEPAHIHDAFSDTIIGAHVSDGCVVLTFGANRISIDAQDNKPTKRRVVSARVALTRNAMSQLAGLVQRLTNNQNSSEETRSTDVATGQ